MATIEFEVHGMEELDERMGRSQEMLRVSVQTGLLKIGKLIVPVKGTGPLADETPKRTGKLRRSTYWEMDLAGNINDLKLEIFQPAKTPDGKFYGEFVREGTRPHEIRPKNKMALRFEIKGKVIFARVVHHPGTKPNPYHKRVMARLHSNLQEIVNEMGTRVTAYLSGR